MIKFSEVLKMSEDVNNKKTLHLLTKAKQDTIEKINMFLEERNDFFGKVKHGDIIEYNNTNCEVIKIGSSYVSVIYENRIEKVWLKDVCIIAHNNKNEITKLKEHQIFYKGYKTKNLSEQLFTEISNLKYPNRFLLVSLLSSYDTLHEDLDIIKKKALFEQISSLLFKLKLPLTKELSLIEDSIILECVINNIKFAPSSKKKIENILDNVDINKYQDSNIIKNLQEMIRR